MKFKRYDKVRKVTGDYRFDGVVLSAYYKLNESTERYDVEDDRGIVHIFGPHNLELRNEETAITDLGLYNPASCTCGANHSPR